MLLALRSLESAGHLVTKRGAHGGVVALGSMMPICLGVAERLDDAGFGLTAVDPRWVKPIDPALIDLARRHAMVVSVEDNGRMGGVDSTLTQALMDADATTPIQGHGVAKESLDHAKSKVIPEWIGVTPETTVADTIAHAPRNALYSAQLVVLCAPVQNDPRSVG